MSEEFNNIFHIVTKVVNYIKNIPLKARLFGKLCEDMGAEYTSLLYYCEVRWLSPSKFIQRVFELKDEIAIFLAENHKDEASSFRNDNFILKLAYLVEIFKKLSDFNKPMQGPQMYALIQNDKVTAFIKKLELRISNLEKDIYDMFPILNDYLPASETILKQTKIFL